MKELRGSAGATVAASVHDCRALLLDIEGYPRWYPDVVRRVSIVRPAADGAPVLARTTVHLGVGPIRRDFDLMMAITSESLNVVRLSRAAHDADDPEELSVTWRIREAPPSETELAVEVRARLEVSRFLPLQGIGDLVAQGFASAARRALG